MLTSYIILFFAILLEVTGTLLLPLSQNFTRPIPTITLALCYIIAIYLLTFIIRTLPIAIVYATWSGLGIFTIAFCGWLFYKQNLSWPVILGLFFITIGVVLVNIYSPHNVP